MAGGLWSKKFDKINGENRVCKQCSDTYHTMKPIWICRKCTNANQRPIEARKRALKGKKENYPFDNKGNESGARFHRIQRELRAAWKEYDKTGDRSVITKHYDKQMKEIKDNGIWKWIWDRRDDISKKENKLKTANMTVKEWPDTRNWNDE